MVSLLYVFIWWDLVPTSPWGKLHPVPTAMLIVTMISIRTHSVLKTPFLQVIGFHGFMLIFFSLPDSGVSSKNLVFSCDGCQEEQGVGEGGLAFFWRKGGWKKKEGELIHHFALCFVIVIFYVFGPWEMHCLTMVITNLCAYKSQYTTMFV